jgi:hypothetical protein
MGKAQMHGESEHEGKVWGRGEHANMPKEVKMDKYPKAHEMGPTVENDTMSRVDEENSRAHSKTRSHMSNQH